MTVPAPVGSIDALAAGIAQRFGLGDVPADRLAEALQGRLGRTGCQDLEAYARRLADPLTGDDEWRLLAAALTVGETYFYRTPEHFQAFAEVALPDRWGRREGDRPLRVVSAGCASGEEAYTLAMVVATTLGPQPPDAIALEAFDLHAEAIERARSARYGAWSLRAMPEALKQQHFERDGQAFRLAPALQDMVHFEARNVLDADDAFWRPGSIDAIFFRNVGIYFTHDALIRVVARFASALAPGGYLFLGPAETLRGLSDAFEPCQSHGTFYYQRRPGTTAIPEAAPESPGARRWAEAIARASERISILTDSPALRAPESPAGQPEADYLEAALALVRAERYLEALAMVQSPPHGDRPEALRIQAAVLSGLGRATEAEAVCHALLRRDEASADAHYVLGLCCEQTGRTDEAVAHHEAAMRLDPTFAMPLWQRGRLARRAGATALAEEALRHALRRLPEENPSRLTLFGGGFRREMLETLCAAEWRASGGTP